jgi:NAD(P)-dependent dehydrogenase (short-subunit alcohol dehydrogenase family)
MHALSLFNLEGKVVVVTGGTGIYGTPVSEAVAEAGGCVIVASRSRKRCENRARQLRQAGWEATPEVYDQGDENSILAFRNRVLEQFGFVDVLINNSISRPMRQYTDSLETWRQSMEVNSTGLFAISRAFMTVMMERGIGSVINIGSVQGIVAPDFTNYDGTDMSTPPDYHFHKHGLIGLTRYMAAWGGGRGVRVNAISPGGFDDGNAKEPFLSQYCRRVFLGRMAGHDDIKGAVVFLASEASGYITGQNIVVDGGYTC